MLVKMPADARSREEVSASIKRWRRTAMGYGAWLLLFGLLRTLAAHGVRDGVLTPTVWLIGLLYMAGAFAIGTMIGLLEPRTKTFGGAAVVGVVVVFSLALALSLMAVPHRSILFKVGVPLVLALVMGPAYVSVMWEEPREK